MRTQRTGNFLSGVSLLAVLFLCGGCTYMATVEVKPTDCINPPAGDCTSGANESRILDVRLYQLKQAPDPCQIDLESFAQGKDIEALKSFLVESQTPEAMRWTFKVAANDPRNLGSWEIRHETSYVLAVAIGRGKGHNSVRLIPIERLKSGWRFPTLHFKGYDICLDRSCDEVHSEVQCR